MTKAILIVDMPRSCAECTLRTSLEANYLYCIATLPRLKIDPMTAHHIKEHKCPLKPMPQEQDIYEIGMDEEDTNAKRQWNKGWDACLNKILGETE